MKTLLRVCAAAACLLSCDRTATIAVSADRLSAAEGDSANWLTHGRTYDEQRFSPLASISATNVGTLGLAWSYELRAERGAEATPIVVDGTMYVTSAWSIVHAIDAATGAEKWVYDPKVDHAFGAKACCDVVNRGVAIFDDKVFVGTMDGRLVALNANTGTLVWESVTVDQQQPYTITGAPRAAKGLVFIGNGGAEYGVRGYVSAYDATTGKLAWRFYTVPGNPGGPPDNAASDAIMAKAAETWKGEWWKLGGGGTVWDAIVYDAAFDQLIIGVGNGAPWNQQVRSPGGGDNWFLSSIVALDAKTGAYKWHYQTTPGDTWDYTATQPIVLAELPINGAPRKVAMQIPKNGFFYVIDRSNGKLISANHVFPMFATKDTPTGLPLSWAYAIDTVTGRPRENPEARYTAGTAVVRPSAFGAHNWHPMSYSPATRLVYVPMQDMALDYTTNPAFVARPGLWNTGTVHGALPDDPAIRAAIKGASKGYLIAWDPVTQKEAWRVEHRGPWNGGTLATAGGLVFQGTIDGRFVAVDATTGKELWSYDTQTPTLAGPVTYRAGDAQYVAVASGAGTGFMMIAPFLAPKEAARVKGRVYAFKVGGAAPKPDLGLTPVMTPKPPAMKAKPADIAAGAAAYTGVCGVCHGFAAIAGGALPDLRRSAALQTDSAWRTIVVGGAKTALGMPSFAKYITPDVAEQIRAYVATQAAMQYAREQSPSSK